MHSTLLKDFEVLYPSLENATMKERGEMIEKLKDKFQIKTLGNTCGTVNWLYDSSPEIITYFFSDKELIADIEFYKQCELGLSENEIRKFLNEFGLWSRPKILFVNKQMVDEWDWKKRYRLIPREVRNSTESYSRIRSIDDKIIDGFDIWLQRGFTEEASKILWHFLGCMPIMNYQGAVVYYYYRTGKSYTCESTLIYQLKNESWINIKGRLYKPSEIHREALIDAG